MNAKQPHKHAALIKAWADGAQIQYSCNEGPWTDCKVNPAWDTMGRVDYRIKPERVFPKSSLSSTQLANLYTKGCHVGNLAPNESFTIFANEVIKQYILDTEAAK